MSGDPSISGTRKLPNPPIIKGITIKKNYNKGVSCNDSVKDLIIIN